MDNVVSLTIAGFINAAIIIMSAAAFYQLRLQFHKQGDPSINKLIFEKRFVLQGAGEADDSYAKDIENIISNIEKDFEQHR